MLIHCPYYKVQQWRSYFICVQAYFSFWHFSLFLWPKDSGRWNWLRDLPTFDSDGTGTFVKGQNWSLVSNAEWYFFNITHGWLKVILILLFLYKGCITRMLIEKLKLSPGYSFSKNYISVSWQANFVYTFWDTLRSNCSLAYEFPIRKQKSWW